MAKGIREAKVWTLMERQLLREIIKEGYSISQLCEKFGWTRWNIDKEMKRGLSSKEYQERRLVKYLPERAVLTDIKKVLTTDTYYWLISKLMESKMEIPIDIQDELEIYMKEEEQRIKEKYGQK